MPHHAELGPPAMVDRGGRPDLCAAVEQLQHFALMRRRLQCRIDKEDAKPNITLHNPLEAGQGLPDAPTFDLIITMDAGETCC